MNPILAIAIAGDAEGLSIQTRMIGNEVSLYFHIPFCTRKCDYCHFYVVPDQAEAKQHLFDAFQLEIPFRKQLLTNKKIVTIYFGGGTPSLFGPSRIASILTLIANNFSLSPSAEITLEVNPEHVTVELMREYANAGINRISIGIQTLDADLLTLLGRGHSPAIALQSIHDTYSAGLTNISIDLMYDLPKQTLGHWEKTLQAIQKLPIEHLSLYNLTIEPHTLFFKKQEQLRPFIPDEQTSLQMYELAIAYLEECGLRQYEISAFAKPGRESRHNTGYWTGRPFLGFGPSAFSYWEEKRFRNIAHLRHYCQALKNNKDPVDFEEHLTRDAQIRELFVIHLRLKSGINLSEFVKKYGPLAADFYQILDELHKSDYLQLNQEGCSLTKKGILFYDTVAAELI